MDGYHYPRDPLPENDPPPPPLTKSMESAAFANRTALEELVFEANRAEREARAIKLQDAEDLARKADRQLSQDRAQARRCLERLKHDRGDEVGRALAAVDACTLLGSWTQWMREGNDDAHVPTKCARKWRRFASAEADWDVEHVTSQSYGKMDGAKPGAGLVLRAEPVAAVDVVPLTDFEGEPSAEPLAAQLKRWFCDAIGLSKVACTDASLPALPSLQQGDWMKLRHDRGRWVRVSGIDRVRKRVEIDAAAEMPPPVARSLGLKDDAGMGASSVEPYELWGAVVVRGLWPPFTAYKLPDGAERRSEGLAKLVRWASEDDGPSTTMRRRVQKASTVLFEAPFLELARAEERALLLRWTPRWTRRDTSTNAKVASDDRAVAGKVSLDKLSSDEVRALLLRPHRLEEVYGRTWASLRIDGARCAAARDAGDWERLGVVQRSHMKLLGSVAEKYRLQGVPEKLVVKLAERQAACSLKLEAAEAEADYTIKLDVFRAGAWQPVYAGPGAGCRVENLKPLTRYRVRCCVAAARGQVSRFAAHAFCTAGPAPKKPRIIRWYKTPPDPCRVATGPGWCERTCELMLAPPRPSRDAVYVVEVRDASEDAWRRCYRGGSDRALVPNLTAGRSYLFRAAFCVGETLAKFGPEMEVAVPGVLPAGGAVPPAVEESSSTEEENEEEDVPTTVLDDEWRVAWSEEKRRPFYHNVATGRSQWTPPLSVG
jgi:hypothetical protein